MYTQTTNALTISEIQHRAPSVFATQPHHAVSTSYRFIPTISMLETLISKGWQVTQAGEHNVRNASKKGYQKHMLRLRHPDAPLINDSELNLIIMNSHDRTSAFRFYAGLYRFVCANGLVTGENLVTPISVKHVGYRAENVIEASYRILDSVPKITTAVQSMASIDLTQTEREAFAHAALVAKYGIQKDENGIEKPLPFKPHHALYVRRANDQKSDLWSTFNVVQENLIKGGLRTRQRTDNHYRTTTRTLRAVSSISEQTKLNQALWTLAEALKTQKLTA